MKNLLLTIGFALLLIGCSKDDKAEILIPVFEIALDGESFDPYGRYSVVSTFGGRAEENGTIKKLFILYLQIDDGNPRLDRQHFAMYLLDSDANNDEFLLDKGVYTWQNPDNKYAGVEIPGPDDYIVWNEIQVQDAGQLGGAHSGLICLTAVGEFFNPYINRTMTVDLKLENIEIGLDIDATPYGYLLD
tara:strand:+ start:76 stop:642 length:567 start_codon:yes stop_codon:yes gene_type:complete